MMTRISKKPRLSGAALAIINEEEMETIMTPKEHIESIRRNKFSIGVGEPNPLSQDLHHSVKNLSCELYAKDIHFLMEIIQNAEDNKYSEGVKPSLQFILTWEDITETGAPSTLLVFNNEIGFSANNIESICGIGRSTKEGQRQSGYIGEKGIGFKSVFLITAQPYIFSNGYQIRFNEKPCPYSNLGYIVPEWVDENPTVADIQNIYGADKPLPTTVIVLPLKSDKEHAVKKQLSSIQPEVLLFLSKIRQLSVRVDHKDSRLNTVNAISISGEIDFVTMRDIGAESYSLQLSAKDDCSDNEGECCYYIWKQKFPVNLQNREDRRMEINDLVVTLAFPNGKRLNRGMSSPGIYAFLPTEMVTNFPFIIQADFILSSSRETILQDSKWNQGILDRVPSAFVNAFLALLKTSGSAPASSLPRMFESLPVIESSYPKLNTVRNSIKAKLLRENIMPSESVTQQKFFYKPNEVGRIMPAFWDILVKAKAQGVSLHSMSSHGKYPLNFAFDKKDYDDILNFLEVKFMDYEWYAKCIRSTNLVSRLSDNVYLELLLFVADNWDSHFKHTNMKNIPLLKYVGQDGHLCTCSVDEVLLLNGKTLYLSSDARYISWLLDWNKEFRCAACFFMPKSTQEMLWSFCGAETLRKWLSDHGGATSLGVNEYANLILNSLNSDRRLVVAFAHFLYHSLSQKYVSHEEVNSLCKEMPLLDNYAGVITQKGGVLVPAEGSKWVGLMGSNPWRRRNYVELGEDYLYAGNFAGVYTDANQLRNFLETHIKASDLPELCPPDEIFPAVSSPLTVENVFLLLEWIRNLRHKGNLAEGNFLRCIKEGSWLKTNLGYRAPIHSFLPTPACSAWERLQNSRLELVDIPLIDQRFYDDRIIQYKDELVAVGVMSEFGEACKFIGKHLMALAANNNTTRSNVFSILNFIRFLTEKCLPPDDFIRSVREGRWLRTSDGERSPVECILFNEEWAAASKISKLPFIDQDYYGKEILSFGTELKLLDVVVGFDKNYQRLAECFRMPSSLSSMTTDEILLILECVRHATSPDELIGLLQSKKWLKTNLGQRSPNECFLVDAEWECLLQIFNDHPLIMEEIYGSNIFSYRNELRKLGVIVDFEKAAKVFAHQFKQIASLCSITKENVLLFLQCYRKLKQKFPTELHHCIRHEKWLKTRLGQRMPKESIMFSSDWEHISSITLLPFIDDSENGYGTAIHDFKEELEDIGVAVNFSNGAKLVASGLCIPDNPADIKPASVHSLLECIRNLRKEPLPKQFLSHISKRWMKTYMGYKQPNECLLFCSDYHSLIQREDLSFLDENFYGFDLSPYRQELKSIGVTVDIGRCDLVASQLENHSRFDVIARIYAYLKKYGWKPENRTARWIWIPNGSDKGRWVSSEECVLYEKNGLFSLQLYVLSRHYDKELMTLFSMVLDVNQNPSVKDYCSLWKTWENSGCRLTPMECSAFWTYMVKHWDLKTKNILAELVKLPAKADSDVIELLNKQDLFIPDDLLLMDLFEKNSPHPLFVWYPQPSSPFTPRDKLNDIYRDIGVRPISEAVQKTDSSKQNGGFKQVQREMLIQRGLIRLVLGFLSDPSVDMDADKRQKTVKPLLEVKLFETEEPISVSYSLSLSSGNSVNVKARQMICWEREYSEMFFQKIESPCGHREKIEYATHFSDIIAQGLLWEKEDRIADLSDLIRSGWFLEFEEEAIGY